MDVEAKKILSGLWAEDGDRTDPDDSDLSPALTRTVGYPDTFSADSGDTPRRPVLNQLFRELDGAAADSMRWGGPLPYDAEIDYYQYAHCTVDADEYVATVANGPATNNVTNPGASGQTVWTRVPGERGTPSAPDAPTAVAGNGVIVWTWNCPLDGGSVVTGFDFEWRPSGTTEWTRETAAVPRHELTGLTNGTTYQARARARNAVGDGAWSATGSGTPAAVDPVGGASLALRADAGDGEVDLDWIEPDDGGSAITGYTYQWRTESQSFSTARQGTAAVTEATVGSLVNDTEYYFRVRATNGEGDGPWSNEASATPVADTTPPPPPADTEPEAPEGLAADDVWTRAIYWEWDLPDGDGGSPVTGFDFQWREDGDAWASGNIVSLDSACYLLTGLSPGTTYDGRARAVNAVGDGAWTSAVSETTDS